MDEVPGAKARWGLLDLSDTMKSYCGSASVYGNPR